MAARPHSKKQPESRSANQSRVQSKTPASRAVRRIVAPAPGPRQCNDEPPLLIESDLSGDTAVGDKELDAIIRLLGEALDDIISDAKCE
jgi:hypothetical protein